MKKYLYWEEKGKYQEDYHRLYEKLIPNTGKAKTKHGNLLRMTSKLYHDLYNNGWGNLHLYWDECRTQLNIFDKEIQSILTEEKFDKIVKKIDDYCGDMESLFNERFHEEDEGDNECALYNKSFLEEIESLIDAVIIIVNLRDIDLEKKQP